MAAQIKSADVKLLWQCDVQAAHTHATCGDKEETVEFQLTNRDVRKQTCYKMFQSDTEWNKTSVNVFKHAWRLITRLTDMKPIF